jgi:uncharacterized NAD(P)/FAD-binding protein YdhS
MHTCQFNNGERSTTIVIVGAGFSGAALALRLLQEPPDDPCRIVLVERSGRFGCGLAYAPSWPNASLNVPAGRMSVDERRPRDFCDYLASRGLPAAENHFAPRETYGEYVGARLQQAAVTAPRRIRLERVSDAVVDLGTGQGDGFWHVRLGDGRSVLADTVVLALGHLPPARIAALRPLEGSGLYDANPWARGYDSGVETPGRVLLVGTGLTMADVTCSLVEGRSSPPRIVAVSRRGLLSRPRRDGDVPPATAWAPDVQRLWREATTRGLVAALRELVADATDSGTDWRCVIAAVREHVPELWHRLGAADRRRFLRHVQPYWDVHRHQLPPAVGRTVQQCVDGGSLEVRAARIVSSRVCDGRAVVGLRKRGSTTVTEETFDRVVNCSGPASDVTGALDPLLRSLLDAGLVSPCSSGIGVRLDAAGRPLGEDGSPARGLFYLGPWARARDFEATAVQELRAQATTLAATLRANLRGHRAAAINSPPVPAPARGAWRVRPAPGSSA